MQHLWEHLAWTDLLYFSVGLSYALALLLLLKVPGLVGQAVAVYKSNRQQTTLLQHISRFFPNKLFNLALHALNALSSINFALAYASLLSPFSYPVHHPTLLFSLLLAVIVYILFLYLRSAIIQAWSYLFPGLYTEPELVKQALWSLSIQVILLKLLLILPAIMLDHASAIVVAWGIVCILLIGVRSWIFIRKSATTSGRAYAVFLYLCTCELSPYVYLLILGSLIRLD